MPDLTTDKTRGKSGNRPADWLRRRATERFTVRYRKVFQNQQRDKLKFEVNPEGSNRP